ncbi:MAG TPA: TfoX/Sxy family protein [Actinomycetota bacterium]|nr:TfoX/Sxy family protein [Actinomycetota bacterium]
MSMSIPKPDERSKEWFRSLVPDDPRVGVRPMFGNLAAFVNGNMFLALFGPDVAVRLPHPDRDELMKMKGAGPFEPMPGRPMKEYVLLPAAWRKDRGRAEAWVERSLRWAGDLPPKKKGK